MCNILLLMLNEQSYINYQHLSTDGEAERSGDFIFSNKNWRFRENTCSVFWLEKFPKQISQ